MTRPALLALADGSVFEGIALGADGEAVGEVVFNTAMTGYQEILTDPSYARQIVTLTYPHIGNTGLNRIDPESSKMHASGLVVRDVPRRHSNWRAESSLEAGLTAAGVVGLAGIDTRKLTRILRERGAQSGCIAAGPALNTERAIAAARAFGGLDGVDLAKTVSTPVPYDFNEGSYDLDSGTTATGGGRYRVTVYDYGVKHNILRLLVDRGCRVRVVPAMTPARDILTDRPDGVLLSNGPGDPAACDYAIAAIRELLAARMPTFGICLGHQLLGLAVGARTVKMKFGHHGANHPVKDEATGRVMISSQNHGFAIDEASLPTHVRVTHRSLFDGSNQGIAINGIPAFSFQGHPEAGPGPHDVEPLFDQFVALMGAKRPGGG